MKCSECKEEYAHKADCSQKGQEQKDADKELDTVWKDDLEEIEKAFKKL